MKDLAKSRTRLLARFGGSVRGATGMVLRCLHPFPRPFPPHPPTMETWPNWGKTSSAGGGAIVQIYLGGMESSAKTRGNSGHYHCMPRGSKDTPPTGCPSKSTGCPVSSTGCVDSSTGPLLHFCVRSSLYLFHFIKKREKEIGLYSENAIHGFENSLNTHSTGRGFNPRVFRGLKNRRKRASMRVCGRFDLDPRIHGLKCLYPGRKGS